MKKLRVVWCAVLALLLSFALFMPQTAVYAENGDGEYVYIGGQPIGISIDIGGLLVESVTGVETEYGIAAVEGLRVGDIIKKIDGESVDSVDDISEMLSAESTSIELIRGGETVTVQVQPIPEAFTGRPRLGIKIKDMIFGVGTVTFVRDDGSYAALGHCISGDDGVGMPFDGGHIHACRVIGVKRGSKFEAGALVASMAQDKVLGTVTCNNDFGIAGKYTEFEKTDRFPLAKRDEVKPGAAQIRTTVNGGAEYYDIEIIKAVKQSGRKEKGMVLRVTDKRLLDITGGVVRGMSGSPILQNGKIVGAVTHVFLNDYTKGYGVYADFLN